MPNPHVVVSQSNIKLSNVGEKTSRFNPQRFVGRVAKELKDKPPPSQAQLDLIANLRKCLDDAGVKNDFIVTPEDNYIASHVIRALIRLAKAHDVDTGRRNKSLNGI